MNIFDLVKKQQDELQANGFKCAIIGHGNDNTLIVSYSKDDYEITFVVPGTERNKRTDWEYLND